MGKHTGDVPVVIDGKNFKLKIDYTALSALEEFCTRKDLESLGDLPIVKIAKILTIALARHHPEITEEFIMAASPPLAEMARAIDHALLYSRYGPQTAEEIIAKMKELEDAARKIVNDEKPAAKSAKKKTG